MKKRKCKTKYCLRKLMLGALVAVLLPLSFAGCRNREMTAERATEYISDRLELSEQQSKQISPIAADLFVEKEFLLETHKAVNDEFLAQMKSETVDAAKLEAVLSSSLEQLRAKLPKLATNFAKFHAVLTPEQRAEIVEKMEERRKHDEKGRWGRHRRGFWN